MRALTSLHADQFEFARAETLRTAQAVPEQKRLFQLQEGRATPLWLLGHLANTINTLVLRWMLDQESLVSRELTRVFAPDFAGGMAPSTDPSLYPGWEEVVSLYDRVMTQAAAGVRALDDSELPNPVREGLPEPLVVLFPNRGAALTRLISHDAYHRGQIGLISKLT